MSGNCFKCNISVIFKEPKKSGDNFGFPCDHCKKVVCQACSDLTSTELRAVLLTKRSMPFFCPDCLSNVKQLLHLVDRVGFVENEIKCLKEDISILPDIVNNLKSCESQLKLLQASNEELESKLNKVGQQPTVSPGFSGGIPVNVAENDFWRELQDRQSRANNLMLFNVNETGDDLKEIDTILNILSDNPPTVVQHRRVGRRNSKGFRALKLTFNSSDIVNSLIRCRRRLKGKNIFLNLDLTPSQQQLEKQVWNELKDRRSKGEDGVHVRYIRGIPQVIGAREN